MTPRRSSTASTSTSCSCSCSCSARASSGGGERRYSLDGYSGRSRAQLADTGHRGLGLGGQLHLARPTRDRRGVVRRLLGLVLALTAVAGVLGTPLRPRRALF